ncbi:hypothetical protein KFL_010930020 [Klebsormidium nitens]|uniref:Uncharacterized protein n=1 Tax=Klebsormidium nitens TaxID=105231 RepID=A0A1Y1IPS6_KLENI|nr:hypothetical protein KFL_010930020 [Klebsormidium nitens]|eukprot:GAQ92683.1 hypothetical protein KFL_010930020 [Klebsormidium nitens]
MSRERERQERGGAATQQRAARQPEMAWQGGFEGVPFLGGVGERRVGKELTTSLAAGQPTVDALRQFKPSPFLGEREGGVWGVFDSQRSAIGQAGVAGSSEGVRGNPFQEERQVPRGASLHERVAGQQDMSPPGVCESTLLSGRGGWQVRREVGFQQELEGQPGVTLSGLSGAGPFQGGMGGVPHHHWARQLGLTPLAGSAGSPFLGGREQHFGGRGGGVEWEAGQAPADFVGSPLFARDRWRGQTMHQTSLQSWPASSGRTTHGQATENVRRPDLYGSHERRGQPAWEDVPWLGGERRRPADASTFGGPLISERLRPAPVDARLQMLGSGFPIPEERRPDLASDFGGPAVKFSPVLAAGMASPNLGRETKGPTLRREFACTSYKWWRAGRRRPRQKLLPCSTTKGKRKLKSGRNEWLRSFPQSWEASWASTQCVNAGMLLLSKAVDPVELLHQQLSTAKREKDGLQREIEGLKKELVAERATLEGRPSAENLNKLLQREVRRLRKDYNGDSDGMGEFDIRKLNFEQEIAKVDPQL